MNLEILIYVLEYLTGLLKAVTVVGSALSLALGAMLTFQPRRLIDLQIAFYRAINWKMEPVSWEREIRNTRIMGVAALICGVFGTAALLYSL